MDMNKPQGERRRRDDRRGGRFELSPSEQLLYDRRSGEGRIVRGADAMR